MAKSATADQTIYFKAVPWSIGDKSGRYSQSVISAVYSLTYVG